MFSKGFQPGYSPKKEMLKFLPSAVCSKYNSSYVVYLNSKEIDVFAYGLNSRDAWENALSRVARLNLNTNEYEVIDEEMLRDIQSISSTHAVQGDK